MNKIENIAAVILAAGSSSRLGQPKQLVPYAEKTLLQHTLDTVLPFKFGSKVLVLGANSSKILAATSTQEFEVIQNQHWQQGMGSSISLATQQVLNNSSIAHILFFLSDQPFINKELINSLIKSHKNEITACRYQDNVGVPAIFSRSYFKELTELQGDKGAKKIMERYKPAITIVDFEKGYIDIDTKEDLIKLNELNQEKL